MLPFEKYYMLSAAQARVNELIAKGAKVTAWRDMEDGKPVWKVEWKV
jgi:hypothetical protein